MQWKCQGKGTSSSMLGLKNRNQASVPEILVLYGKKKEKSLSNKRSSHVGEGEHLLFWLALSTSANQPTVFHTFISCLCPFRLISRDQSSPPWPETEIFKWPRAIKQKPSLGELRIGEEWLQEELLSAGPAAPSLAVQFHRWLWSCSLAILVLIACVILQIYLGIKIWKEKK